MILVNEIKIETLKLKCDNEDLEGKRTSAEKEACLE